MLANASGYLAFESGVQIVGPDVLDEVAAAVTELHPGPSVDVDRFLDPSAYRPLPSPAKRDAARGRCDHPELAQSTIDRANA